MFGDPCFWPSRWPSVGRSPKLPVFVFPVPSAVSSSKRACVCAPFRRRSVHRRARKDVAVHGAHTIGRSGCCVFNQGFGVRGWGQGRDFSREIFQRFQPRRARGKKLGTTRTWQHGHVAWPRARAAALDMATPPHSRKLMGTRGVRAPPAPRRMLTLARCFWRQEIRTSAHFHFCLFVFPRKRADGSRRGHTSGHQLHRVRLASPSWLTTRRTPCRLS